MRRWRMAPIVLLVLVLVLGWWLKARCLVDGDGWVGGEEYRSWCYTDVFPLWFDEGLDRGAVPYLDHPVEYPVLTGAQMWLANRLAPLVPGHQGVAFFHVTALLGAGLLIWTMRMMRDLGLPEKRLAWLALAPTMTVYAFMNWDPLAVALSVAALAAHLRGRDVPAGILAGLGVAAKLFPGLIVPVVVATRLAQRRGRDALWHVLAAAGAWTAVNLPVWLAAPEAWRTFYDFNRQRPPDWDSLWLLAEEWGLLQWSVPRLNLMSAVAFLAGATAIAWVGGRRRKPDQWWELLLPLLAWFLLTNKVYSPQFSLWLLPFMALALPSRPLFFAFCVADLSVFFVRFSFLGAAAELAPGADYPLFAAMLVIRAAVLCGIIVSATRDRPEPIDLPEQALA